MKINAVYLIPFLFLLVAYIIYRTDNYLEKKLEKLIEKLMENGQ